MRSCTSCCSKSFDMAGNDARSSAEVQTQLSCEEHYRTGLARRTEHGLLIALGESAAGTTLFRGLGQCQAPELAGGAQETRT
jgi:hypothetical protein